MKTERVEHDPHIDDMFNRHNGLDALTPELARMIEGYHIVSMRRNPWARLVSFYCWAHEYSGMPQFANKLPFIDWLEKFRVSKNIDSCWHKGCDKTGTQLVDQFMRTEHLQADLDIMCDKVGMKRLKLKRLLTTSHDHYSHYYNDENRDKAAEVYADDIKHFGYVFEDRR